MIWFKKIGWFYIPINSMGLLVVVLTGIFLFPIIVSVHHNSNSLSDEAYHLFIYLTCTGFWLKWVAENTSPSDENDEMEEIL